MWLQLILDLLRLTVNGGKMYIFLQVIPVGLTPKSGIYSCDSLTRYPQGEWRLITKQK